MRRQIFVMLALLLALGTPLARAQSALSPRGIFAMMTRPLAGCEKSVGKAGRRGRAAGRHELCGDQHANCAQ